MWRPPQRIQFTPTLGSMPSREEAKASRLFSPIAYGALKLEQRTWVPAMVPWRATDDGFVTDAVVNWYARFAAGQPGAIVVEATGIRDVPSGPLLRIGDDRFVDGLRRLVDATRAASGGRTKIFIQLIDFLSIRRRPNPRQFFERFLVLTDAHRRAFEGASDLAIRARLAAMPRAELVDHLSERELQALDYGHREQVNDTELAHIQDLPKTLPGLFTAAALRAQQAGLMASSFTMRTPIQWLRSCRGRTRVPMATAARAKTVSGCRSKYSMPSARGSTPISR